MIRRSAVLAVLVLAAGANTASAQFVPEVGYVYPPGGKAGTTVNVHLGGQEWTPDMQFFVHDKRVKLEILGPPGELLIPPPPYWFGAKGRLSALPLLRELPAKFTLPADLPPGPIRWQAANANGATSAGIFIVGSGTELLEDEKRTSPQVLPTLPATVSGRLLKNEEVDRYKFTAAKAGPVTCELTARRLGSNFNGVIEVYDAQGKKLAESVDTEGNDAVLTFSAAAGAEYTVAVRDIDHAGDRSYTYRLEVRPVPRVLATLPTSGKRGETREVEFIGVGIVTGGATVETLKKSVAFPADPTAASFTYKLETQWGTVPHVFALNDLPEAVAPPGSQPQPLAVPGAVTGILDSPNAELRYIVQGKKGDRWSIAAEARRYGSPLDVTLRILGPDMKELAKNDDLPGTTDAGLEFTVPLDGAYQIAVSDSAGTAGARSNIFRLSVRPPVDGFTLHVPVQKFSAVLGGKVPITVQAKRTGDFKGPITLSFTGLPAGVTATPAALVIPPTAASLAVTLEVAADAAVTASMVTITGTADVGGKPMTQTAFAPTTGNLAARSPEETATLLIAMTMKPRVKGAPVDKDTGRKVPRGSTHPADIILERLEGYTGEILLRQSTRQSYQVQGITGRDTVVAPGVTKIAFPCFMPEWLETSRTSRMGISSVVKVPDPKGNVRYLVAPIDGFVTMTMEGALLKLSHPDEDRFAKPGETIAVRVKLARSAKLTEPVKLELLPGDVADAAKAEPIRATVAQGEVEFKIVLGAKLAGEQTFTIRGTAIQPGNLPVVSETVVRVTLPTR